MVCSVCPSLFRLCSDCRRFDDRRTGDGRRHFADFEQTAGGSGRATATATVREGGRRPLHTPSELSFSLSL